MRVTTRVLHHRDAYEDDLTDIVAARRLDYLSSLDGKIKPSRSLCLTSDRALLHSRVVRGSEITNDVAAAAKGENECGW